jgi:DNA-binding transcriptional MerR regulator
MALSKLPSDQKMYYTIGEVADIFSVNHSLIRFWEKEFPILKPKKNKKGNRLFTPTDLENLRIIFHLVKERGFTLEGARKKMRENKGDVAKNVDVVNKLIAIRARLVTIRENL